MKISVLRSKVSRLQSEIRNHTDLPVKLHYKLHIVRNKPKKDVGTQGDWAISFGDKNVYFKTITGWLNVFSVLKGRHQIKKIYTTSRGMPPVPYGDINPGWSTKQLELKYLNTHIWSSQADYIGNIRVSKWSNPIIEIRGVEVDKPKKVELLLTTRFIYIASKQRPPLNRRADDPTKNSEWSFSRSASRSSRIPIWQSRGNIDQFGNLHGRWTVPIRITEDIESIEEAIDEKPGYDDIADIVFEDLPKTEASEAEVKSAQEAQTAPTVEAQVQNTSEALLMSTNEAPLRATNEALVQSVQEADEDEVIDMVFRPKHYSHNIEINNEILEINMGENSIHIIKLEADNLEIILSNIRGKMLYSAELIIQSDSLRGLPVIKDENEIILPPLCSDDACPLLQAGDIWTLTLKNYGEVDNDNSWFKVTGERIKQA